MNDLTPMTAPLCYLATPYSKFSKGIHNAYIGAAQLAASLVRAGVKVYSPIVHCHPIAMYGDMDPLDHSIWIPFDEAMMDAAAVLLVAHMQGWEDSYGIAVEVEFFEARRRPIFDLDPITLTMTRRS